MNHGVVSSDDLINSSHVALEIIFINPNRTFVVTTTFLTACLSVPFIGYRNQQRFPVNSPHEHKVVGDSLLHLHFTSSLRKNIIVTINYSF